MPETEIFLGRAKLETFRRDVARMRKAVTDWDAEATEKAWGKLERWLSCVNPNTIDDGCRKDMEGRKDGA